MGEREASFSFRVRAFDSFVLGLLFSGTEGAREVRETAIAEMHLAWSSFSRRRGPVATLPLLPRRIFIHHKSPES